MNSYTYLGNLVTIEGNHEKEISTSRRLGIAWSNFEKLDKYHQQPTFRLDDEANFFGIWCVSRY